MNRLFKVYKYLEELDSTSLDSIELGSRDHEERHRQIGLVVAVDFGHLIVPVQFLEDVVKVEMHNKLTRPLYIYIF